TSAIGYPSLPYDGYVGEWEGSRRRSTRSGHGWFRPAVPSTLSDDAERPPVCPSGREIHPDWRHFAPPARLRPVTASSPPLPRFDQGLLALLLVIGFVFAAPEVIPIVAVVAAISAVRPESSPVPKLIVLLVENRL